MSNELVRVLQTEFKDSAACRNSQLHSATYDRMIKEYFPLLGTELKLAEYAALLSLGGYIVPELLSTAQREHLLVVDDFVILEPLKKLYREYILLKERSIFLEEELDCKSNQLNRVEGSTSFRVGLVMTAVPRKIKQCINR